MPQRIVAGNWKMNKTWPEALALVAGIHESLEEVPADIQLIISAPFPYLHSLSGILEPRISLAAQDCSAHSYGAYTGEVSASMLLSCGVQYGIVGHSERRKYHGESEEIVFEKAKRLLEAGIRPIYCCGESLDDRQQGRAIEVVLKQLELLMGLENTLLRQIVIAYEPVWAVGTGITATSQEAGNMHAEIRRFLSAKGALVAENLSILYGGSCNADNAKELFATPNIDGGLIGGASLKAADFISIACSYEN
jgi:triosephosphate isomerase